MSHPAVSIINYVSHVMQLVSVTFLPLNEVTIKSKTKRCYSLAHFFSHLLKQSRGVFRVFNWFPVGWFSDQNYCQLLISLQKRKLDPHHSADEICSSITSWHGYIEQKKARRLFSCLPYPLWFSTKVLEKGLRISSLNYQGLLVSLEQDSPAPLPGNLHIHIFFFQKRPCPLSCSCNNARSIYAKIWYSVPLKELL